MSIKVVCDAYYLIPGIVVDGLQSFLHLLSIAISSGRRGGERGNYRQLSCIL